MREVRILVTEHDGRAGGVVSDERGLVGLLHRANWTRLRMSAEVVLRLTSYIGARPVQRLELRDITTDIGDFHVDLPAGLPTIEERLPRT